MKRIFLLVLLLVSCSDSYASRNDAMTGVWRLEMTTIGDGCLSVVSGAAYELDLDNLQAHEINFKSDVFVDTFSLNDNDILILTHDIYDGVYIGTYRSSLIARIDNDKLTAGGILTFASASNDNEVVCSQPVSFNGIKDD